MTADTTATSEQWKNRDGNGASPATISIATTGEIFADGSLIELISDDGNGSPKLMLWDGARETVGAIVEFGGWHYEPATISKSILRELMLPARCCPHGTTRELLAEIRRLVVNLVGGLLRSRRKSFGVVARRRKLILRYWGKS
jgi:hypothetical protein